MRATTPGISTTHGHRFTRCVAFTLLLATCWSCKTEPDPPATAPDPQTATKPSDNPAAVVPTTPAPTETAAPKPPESCNAKETRSDDPASRDMQDRENKIVGGKPAGADDFPFMVALATGTGSTLRQYCGGSLVAKDWVLTAAHCQVRPGEKAIVGRLDLTKPGGDVLGIKRVLNHAAYDPDTNDNDIALLQLETPATVDVVAPYAGDSDLATETAVVVGWGKLSESGPGSSILQEVSVPVVANATCTQGYAPDGVGITQNMLCAGLATGGKDSCQGDSGGPLLVVGQGGKLQQAGVVSFGIGCARPNRYGVYTRVSKYAGWITACMK